MVNILNFEPHESQVSVANCLLFKTILKCKSCSQCWPYKTENGLDLAYAIVCWALVQKLQIPFILKFLVFLYKCPHTHGARHRNENVTIKAVLDFQRPVLIFCSFMVECKPQSFLPFFQNTYLQSSYTESKVTFPSYMKTWKKKSLGLI